MWFCPHFLFNASLVNHLILSTLLGELGCHRKIEETKMWHLPVHLARQSAWCKALKCMTLLKKDFMFFTLKAQTRVNLSFPKLISRLLSACERERTKVTKLALLTSNWLLLLLWLTPLKDDWLQFQIQLFTYYDNKGSKIDCKNRCLRRSEEWNAGWTLWPATWLLPVFPWLVFKDASISANLMRQLPAIIWRWLWWNPSPNTIYFQVDLSSNYVAVSVKSYRDQSLSR